MDRFGRGRRAVWEKVSINKNKKYVQQLCSLLGKEALNSLKTPSIELQPSDSLVSITEWGIVQKQEEK